MWVQGVIASGESIFGRRFVAVGRAVGKQLFKYSFKEY